MYQTCHRACNRNNTGNRVRANKYLVDEMTQLLHDAMIPFLNQLCIGLPTIKGNEIHFSVKQG